MYPVSSRLSAKPPVCHSVSSYEATVFSGGTKLVDSWFGLLFISRIYYSFSEVFLDSFEGSLFFCFGVFLCSDAYLEPYQTPTMKFFGKNN